VSTPAPSAAPPPAPAADAARYARWPAWARPREREERGIGRVRLVEAIVIIVVGLVLAVAAVNDLGRKVGINHRIQADLNTWRAITGHDYLNVGVEQSLTGTTREVACANVSPGAPGVRTQICLVMTGPVVDGRRTVSAGYFLLPHMADGPRERIGCFGPGDAGLCHGSARGVHLPAPPVLLPAVTGASTS
jgi:hypothetical protein